MAAVTSDLKARERSAELRQLVGKKYRYIDRKWDVMFWVTAAFVVGAAADITKLLFAGDWDFWTDWKDAQWWPIITPFAIIIIPSALQYIQWLAWKFPTGAVYTALSLWLAAEIGRIFQWSIFVYYPLNFVWPVTAVIAALWLDYVLLKTKSFVLTSVIGGMGFAFILWFTNYVMLSPFLQPVSFMGHTLTVADVQGIQYLRSQTPEYLRLVQQGSLRTFLGETLYVSLVFGLVLTIFSSGAAWAHGENAQESWLRMNTVAFWNVNFSTDTIKQGETVTITGTAKVLETWPKTLKGPDTAYLSVVAPGPVFLMKDRVINDQAAPASFYVQKGSVYNFNMTIQGRIPGRYHVKTVNLENFGLAWPVNGFSILTFLVGLVWLLYWIVPKPTVSRLAVTSQLSVNDDGGDAVGLITRKDHRAMNWIMLAAALLLIGGWIYEARAFPVKIPQQVDRFTIPSAPAPATIATASMSKVTYDTATQTLTATVSATNKGDTPMQMKDLHIAGLRFANTAAGSQGGDGQITVQPSTAIAPGQTQELTMTIRGGLLEQQRLIPVGSGQSNTYMTFVADFQNTGGVDNFLTVSQFLTPVFD